MYVTENEMISITHIPENVWNILPFTIFLVCATGTRDTFPMQTIDVKVAIESIGRNAAQRAQ